MRNYTLNRLASGTHNRLPNYEIPADSAQDSLNWVTIDGAITIATGKQILGAEGASGECRNLWFGTRNDGTKVLYAKYGDKIGYWNGTTLATIVSGLTVNADYSFQNYTSLAGNFTYATGIDGIYKFHNASLGSHVALYDGAKNYKGYCLIDKARMYMVGLTNDPTGIYGSKIDPQGANYTTVTSETMGTGNGTQTTFTGTLAFKGGNPNSTCFGLRITQGANSSTDNYNGAILGSNITVGTINYVTGAFSITFTTPPPNLQVISVTYQHENPNVGGLTDFTKSATRLASEGFIIRQDEGGDAIQKVVVGIDGAYYSIKKSSVYRLSIDDTDTKFSNEVFRKDLGMPYYQMAISAGMGIVFMNTANPDKPELTLLDKNPLGDTLIPSTLFPHYKFENYVYDQGVLDTWGRYIVIACRKPSSLTNDVLLLCDKVENTVMATSYGMKCLAKDGGLLYGGSALTQTIWQLFRDYDDDDYVPENYYKTRSENYKLDSLKKVRSYIFQGNIDKDQQIEVSAGYDDTEPTIIGTIRGDGEYVDKTNPSVVGGGPVGSQPIGGSPSNTVYPYQVEIKAKVPKFDVRTLSFRVLSLGYASVNYVQDHDILTFENKIGKRYRLKQNVSLDGKTTNKDTP